MVKNPIGRPEKPTDEKTVKVSVSLSFAVFEFLKSLPNRSEFINKAIIERIQKLKIAEKYR